VTQSAAPKKGGGTVGIVVGVIVGLIVFGALAGAAFIFLRNRKHKEAEEYKRHNDVDAFVGGGSKSSNDRPQMWASQDPRLDTDAAGRRASNGSIADNQDYSRRILAVSACFTTDSKKSFVLTFY
jgi:cell wall integrity and stress response component